MNVVLKQRLVGAVVLVAVAVIFLPSVLRQQQPEPVDTRSQIPDPPALESLSFAVPEPPPAINPAPEPETMFVPEESTQPVVESLEQLTGPVPEQAPDQALSEALDQESEPSQNSPQTETAAPADSDTSDRAAWVIQVASLRSSESARGLRDRLQEQGYKAYVRSVTINGNEVSRVYIGPKLERSAADAIKADIDQQLQVNALVLRFQP